MSELRDQLERALFKYDFANLSSSDCARALRDLIDALREDSFYSSRHKNLSPLRLQRAFLELEKSPELQRQVHVLLIATLNFFDLSTLLTQTGLAKPHGFFTELISRLLDKVIPHHSPRPNFMELSYFLFPVPGDSQFFQRIPPDILQSFYKLLDSDLKSSEKGLELLLGHCVPRIREALLILSAHCLVLSENPDIKDIRWTVNQGKATLHSFLNLNEYIHRILSQPSNDSPGPSSREIFKSLLLECQRELLEIRFHLEKNSLSVNLVYQLEVLQVLLWRIESLLTISEFKDSKANAGSDFFAALIMQEQKRRSVRILIGHNLHYLAKKIVDCTGESGEHYIARNPAEMDNLFKASLGGGFLTGFTVLIKILIHRAHFALFFEGLFSGLNYAGSFIGMQLMHLTLATKQPAMTAASLAKRMTEGAAGLGELRLELRNLLKSQLATAAGNLCAVIPTSYCLFLIWQSIFQGPVFSPEEAREFLKSHHPLKSLTLFYALITGIILFSAGLVHGWVENWMRFRRIPELVSDSFLLENFLSRGKRLSLGLWLRKNLSGFAANACLGFLLAFTPVIGDFFGLPLEVRHVTLATGGITLAWASLPWSELTLPLFLTSLASILVILLGNIVTSFLCSLWLALKARGWTFSDLRSLMRRP